jgi:hypothetical protein
MIFMAYRMWKTTNIGDGINIPKSVIRLSIVVITGFLISFCHFYIPGWFLRSPHLLPMQRLKLNPQNKE